MTSPPFGKKWDRRFLELAHHIAKWSKDRSAKTGCVIVDTNKIVRSTGYNGFVRRVNDDDDTRHERPAKYDWSEHAERNAIYNAARLGVSIEGCHAFVNWFPCKDCARAFVQSGIVRVVALRPDETDERWGEHFTFASDLFKEAGVEVNLYDYPRIVARKTDRRLKK